MCALFESSRFFSFPRNRYQALDEVQSLLEFNGVDLGQAFEVLLNSHDGYLIYWFGSVQIQFTHGFAWSGSQSDIQMFIELENEKMNKTAAYEYKLRDLRLVKEASVHRMRVNRGQQRDSR